MARKEKLAVQKARQQVTAPIDGEVLMLYHQIGAYVTSGSSLALVGDFTTLYFTGSIEDKYARRLAPGDEAELVFRRAVETGANDGEYIEILSGISRGETVVTSGMEGLANGMKAEIEPEGAAK